VQVRVDGHQPVDETGQEAAHDGLADRLAGVEGVVLSHVAQVRRQQRHRACPGRTQGLHRQQQFDQLVVRAVEAAQQHHLGGDRRRHGDPGLTVRKTMHLHQRGLGPQRAGQRLRLRRAFGESENEGRDGAVVGRQRGSSSWQRPGAGAAMVLDGRTG